jgi:hypothetical protein
MFASIFVRRDWQLVRLLVIGADLVLQQSQQRGIFLVHNDYPERCARANGVWK